MALSAAGAEEDDETTEDAINRLMESRKLLPNASYFAFTATPKNKTLEIFGEPYEAGGQVKHRPFHSYTMKQAIQEGFILDVLQNYTPVAELLQARKEDRGRSRVRHEAGREEAPRVRRGQSTMRSASRPRSWSITFTSRSSR